MKRSYSGYLYIVLCAVIFSTMEVMLKTVHGVFAPMQITCLRFLIGGLLLVPFALRSMKKKGAAFTRADVGFFALTGFLCVAFSMVLYQMAVTYTKASVVAIIFSCNPIFVTMLAYFLLREEIHRNHLIALALELLAVLIIIDPLHASLDPTGALLAIASALVFSFYSVVGKKRTPRFGGIAVTCFSFLFGSVIIFCFILITHIPAVAGFFQSIGLPSFAQIPILEGYTLQNLPYVLYVSAGVAGVGFCAYFLAMEYQPASVVSLVYFFKPALSPILAWMVHGEEIPGNMLAGILLILAGSFANIIPGILEIRRAKQQMPSN